ncbi:hypothetical protein Leryth_024148 [Lithospermum erythrorhizon]|nr:hypothetical protein Leryth_024148 [Lithospermum erythrorhizon]
MLRMYGLALNPQTPSLHHYFLPIKRLKTRDVLPENLKYLSGFHNFTDLELNLCNRLTSLKVENGAKRYIRERGKMQLPASLRKLSLSKFKLDSDDISEIGKSLPSLEVLKLHDSFESWSVNDEDFPKLKVLKISGGYCREWHASEDSFPSLERLFLERCYTLGGIPLCFGDIPCLLLISIKYCNSSVYESARDIEKDISWKHKNLELKTFNYKDGSWLNPNLDSDLEFIGDPHRVLGYDDNYRWKGTHEDLIVTFIVCK